MLTIHMHNDGRVQVVDQETKPHKTRYVSLEEMVESFRGQAMQSSILPEGTIQYWRGHGYEIIALYRAPHTRKMYLYESEFTLPVPGTVFLFRINTHDSHKTTLSESAIFTVAGKWNGAKTQLCGYPYGNVFEDHTICWGDLEFSNVTLSQLAGAPDVFLGSAHNDDLEGHYQNPDHDTQNLYSFWEDIATMPSSEHFPEKRMVPVCLYEELPSYETAIFY